MNKPAAVIDISSNAVYMKIAENRDGVVQELESLEVPIDLGHQTFTYGKVDFDTIRKLAEILHGYKSVLADYGVKQYNAFSTTAIREAANREYIIDQIRISEEIDIRVYDDGDEKAFIYSEILRRMIVEKKLPKNALLAYIGTGSVGIAHYYDDAIIYSRNIRIGSVKLQEMLGHIEDSYGDFATILDEYISTSTSALSGLRAYGIRECVASGKELELIASICGVQGKGDIFKIPKDKLTRLYAQVRDYTPYQICRLYDISEEQSEILLPALSLYTHLLDFTEAEEIVGFRVLLSDALLAEMLEADKSDRMKELFSAYAVRSAAVAARSYLYDEAHSSAVKGFAVRIFDKLRKLHGLSRRDRMLLEVAAELHNIGKYINTKFYYQYSYDIIKNLDIIGLRAEDMLLVAHIARNHSIEMPDYVDDMNDRLSAKERMKISKLSAIIKLADALDRSHKQKLSVTDISLREGILEIHAASKEHANFERWTFDDKKEYFKEVYGLNAKLTVRVKSSV